MGGPPKVDHRVGEAAIQAGQVQGPKKLEAQEIQQAKWVEQMLEDTGTTKGQLGKIAEVMGFGKGEKAIQDLCNYLYQNYPKLKEAGIKIGQGQKPTPEQEAFCQKLGKAYAALAKHPGFSKVLFHLMGKAKTDPQGNKVPRFVLVLTPGDEGKPEGAGRFYGFELVTSTGKKHAFTSANGKLQGFLEKLKAALGRLKPDGTPKEGETVDPEIVELAKELGGLEGLEALVGALDDVGKAIGSQPPQSVSPKQGESGKSGPSNNDINIKVLEVDYNELAQGILINGMKEIKEAISNYVKESMAEDARFQKEAEKAQEIKQQKEAVQKKISDKVKELKTKITQCIKEGNVGALIAIKGELDKLTGVIDACIMEALDKDMYSEDLRTDLGKLRDDIEGIKKDVDEALRPYGKEIK